MEVLYGMVVISLGLSLLFLRFFFWAVDNDQLTSVDQASFNLLEDEEGRGKNDE